MQGRRKEVTRSSVAIIARRITLLCRSEAGFAGKCRKMQEDAGDNDCTEPALVRITLCNTRTGLLSVAKGCCARRKFLKWYHVIVFVCHCDRCRGRIPAGDSASLLRGAEVGIRTLMTVKRAAHVLDSLGQLLDVKAEEVQRRPVDGTCP